jgi:hypothetical protein
MFDMVVVRAAALKAAARRDRRGGGYCGLGAAGSGFGCFLVCTDGCGFSASGRASTDKGKGPSISN